MEEMTLLVQKREATGKNVNRRLRAEGLVPAVVYGGGRDSVAIQVRQRKVEELLRKSGSDNAVFLLELEGTGKSRHTMIRELDLDPLNGKMVHIDFQRVDMSSDVRVEVAIEIQGIPEGVKTEGGLLDFVTREVEVTCLPRQDSGPYRPRCQPAEHRPARRSQRVDDTRRRDPGQ